MAFLKILKEGIPLDPLPIQRARDESVPHAPKRNTHLSFEEEQVIYTNSSYT